MEIKGFRDLKVWQYGMELVKEVYKLTAAFPGKELYGITSRMRRASISVPANIAEGYNRYHRKDYQRFLYITPGSCGELDTLVELAYHLEYIVNDQRDALSEFIDHESRMLNSLISRLN